MLRYVYSCRSKRISNAENGKNKDLPGNQRLSKQESPVIAGEVRCERNRYKAHLRTYLGVLWHLFTRYLDDENHRNPNFGWLRFPLKDHLWWTPYFVNGRLGLPGISFNSIRGPTGSRNPLEVNDSNLWKGLTTWMSQEDSKRLVFEL